MADEPDLATCAQIIATLFVALAIEAQAVGTRKSPWAVRRGLHAWMTIFLAVSATVLSLDVAALLGFRFFPIVGAGRVLPFLNLVAIFYTSFMVIAALVDSTGKRSVEDAPPE